MSLLDQLWDDTVAGPRPDSGLKKLRKHPTFSFRPSTSSKDQEIASPRSVGDLASPRSIGDEGGDDMRVTRSIMIMKPSTGSPKDSPPVSPAGSTPPVSPFAGRRRLDSGGSLPHLHSRRQVELDPEALLLLTTCEI